MKTRSVTKEMREQLACCEMAIKQIQSNLSSKSKEQIEEEVKMTKALLEEFLQTVDVQYLNTSFNYSFSLN